MHDLFFRVLSKKDLSKAGDLFLVADSAIEHEVSDVLLRIRDITSQSDYVDNDNDQSIVEICLTRVTTAIRDTESIEKHVSSLVGLLESCLNHDLKLSVKNEDPPHIKIASDIISCLFLNYSKREVMKLSLPVAVKFLHKGNKELSRSLASYLSLAAIQHSDLLANHVQPIIDSIISGNYSLSKVLPQIYNVNKEPIHEHVMALVSLLPLCETSEKLVLLALFHQIAKNKPSILEPSLPQLLECTSSPATAVATLQLLQGMAMIRPHVLSDHVTKLRSIAGNVPPIALPLIISLVSGVGKLGKDRGWEAIEFILTELKNVEPEELTVPLHELVVLCDLYPSLLTDRVIAEVELNREKYPYAAKPHLNHLINEYQAIRSSPVNRTSDGVTVVKICPNVGSKGDSKPKQDVARSIPRICPNRNAPLGSYKSVNRLGSSHTSLSLLPSRSPLQLPLGDFSIPSPPQQPPMKSISSGCMSVVREQDLRLEPVTTSSTASTIDKVSMMPIPQHSSSGASSLQISPPVPVVVRRPEKTVDSDSEHPTNMENQRMSVFEPMLMRDGVQHFCEKHLDKIRSYMEKVFVKLPLPSRCGIEERKHRKFAKLYFSCQGRGDHCLYSRKPFMLKTHSPRTWIHLMFLALQARSSSALSTREPSVTCLKNCWEILQSETQTFLTVVTSTFPSTKEQELLLLELQEVRFLDVFEYNGVERQWGCFLCNHPDRFPTDPHRPLIEGRLKEKKGKWKLFRRWRTRYFTLSGAHLTARGSVEQEHDRPISLQQIRSVKTINRSGRNIPKAFEIFTTDRSFVLKPKDTANAGEWVQCLTIAVAHSHNNPMMPPTTL